MSVVNTHVQLVAKLVEQSIQQRARREREAGLHRKGEMKGWKPWNITGEKRTIQVSDIEFRQISFHLNKKLCFRITTGLVKLYMKTPLLWFFAFSLLLIVAHHSWTRSFFSVPRSTVHIYRPLYHIYSAKEFPNTVSLQSLCPALLKTQFNQLIACHLFWWWEDSRVTKQCLFLL
jgi:hypothetical protein